MHPDTLLPCSSLNGAVPMRKHLRTRKRTACQPGEGGCRRCQLVPADLNAPTLLLGPPDENAATALRQALQGGGVDFAEEGAMLKVPLGSRDLGRLRPLLQEALTPFALTRIRAAYAPGAGAEPEQLAAALFATPLLDLLRRAEHEWVRDVLAGDRLFSVFQPILDARTGEIFAQEALLRARAGEGEAPIAAGRLIAACEQLQLEHVLDQKARQAAIRGAAEHVARDVRIFINFLPNTIYDPAICLRTTMETAADCGVELSRLVFEVVETENIPDMPRLQRILDYYRERGVGTAVDDMGAGFTNLGYISALRPDFVKLDRALVAAAEQEPEARGRMEHLIQAAAAAGSRVIAEGIETDGQLQLCRAAGVDFVQGYLFARPSCPPAAPQWQAGW